MNYILTDTFNNKAISRHRTIAAAINARDKHLKAVRKANGRDSFLTYSIDRMDGHKIDKGELDREEWYAYRNKLV
jgi:hypothetical protein